MRFVKFITCAFVLLITLFLTHEVRAQTVSGYTSIDYYEDTNIVDAYSETDEDYDADTAYTAFVKLSVIDQNWNTMGFQSASDDGTYGFASVEIEFFGSPDKTYTVTGMHRAYTSLWDYDYTFWPFYSIYYYDPYYFTMYENQNITAPWYYSFLGSGPMVTRPTQPIILGSTVDQASVAILSPDHVRVVLDQQGVICTGGLQVRQITMQIVDSSNAKVTHLTWVEERFADVTSNTCGNGSPDPSGCSPADSGGTFIDSMAVSDNLCNSSINHNSGCGYTLTSTWSVCSGGSSKDLWQYHGETRSNIVKVDGSLNFIRGTLLYAPNTTP